MVQYPYIQFSKFASFPRCDLSKSIASLDYLDEVVELVVPSPEHSC
jgi:hypothetical protein